MKQHQFLQVLERDEAERKWRSVVSAAPVGIEEVPLEAALGRVLARDQRAVGNVPGFDRANMDGFAIRAADTYGASEEKPKQLRLNDETLATGVAPRLVVQPGTATPIATGGILPRGADAVAPVEHTDLDADGRTLLLRHARAPGAAVSFAGADIGQGETVLFAGARLSSRETGVLAAIGAARVPVFRRPLVAVLSTGDEIVQPGEALQPGFVFDSNGRILCDAVAELGATPRFLGVVRDDEQALRAAIAHALESADLLLLSGGTSKGEGDLGARVVSELEPGVVVHGVALKPGKPICLAASGAKPVVVLPGFPTSAIFTFHEFVAPLLRNMLGLPPENRETRPARLALAQQSERGRLEYLLVGLTRPATGSGELKAWPMGKGSGSVTAFSRADGFIRIPRNTELLDADAAVEVTLMGSELPLADLLIIGSHCVGLDRIAAALSEQGLRIKLLAVGSESGLEAAGRGECDVAPVHLLDPASGRYNTPFLKPGLRLVAGYTRMQGVVTRKDETRALKELLDDDALHMVNRNRGSGTRALIDEVLGERRPPGFAYEPRSHYAVAAAVAQRRADWGVAIETVVEQHGLRFLPLREERYDFIIPEARFEREPVRRLRALLAPGSPLRAELRALGFGDPDG